MTNAFDTGCPTCFGTDKIDILARVWVRLTTDGTDADLAQDTSQDWDDESHFRCGGCGATGSVGELISDADGQDRATEKNATKQ